MVKHAVGGDEEKLSDILTDVSENISAFIEEEAATSEKEEPIILSEKEITPILTDSGLSEEQAEKISKEFKTFFNEEPPEAGELLDSKLLKDSELKNEKKALQEKVGSEREN
jgi:ParB-like chromosome segregation protein Spo0J